MAKLLAPFPNKRKFGGKWFELDRYDDGLYSDAFRRYLDTIKKRGFNYRIVAKTYPGFGTHRGVYIRQTRTRIPENLANLRHIR